MPVNPDDVREIRERLSKVVKRHLSQAEFGAALGMAGEDRARRIRRWEQEPGAVSGPGAMALDYLRQGLETTKPKFLRAIDDQNRPYVVHLHWPRYVAAVEPDGTLDVEWIDDPGRFRYGSPGWVHGEAFKDAPSNFDLYDRNDVVRDGEGGSRQLPPARDDDANPDHARSDESLGRRRSARRKDGLQ